MYLTSFEVLWLSALRFRLTRSDHHWHGDFAEIFLVTVGGALTFSPVDDRSLKPARRPRHRPGDWSICKDSASISSPDAVDRYAAAVGSGADPHGNLLCAEMGRFAGESTFRRGRIRAARSARTSLFGRSGKLLDRWTTEAQAPTDPQ